MTDIKLALVREPEPHPDLRGTVTETYRESWFPGVPPVKQLVQSDSDPNVLRGMHLHKRQWDLWRFTGGEAVVRLYDPRTGRNEFVKSGNRVIAIPPGIAHGFYAEWGCTLVYALTEEYTGADEFGFFPFDGVTDEEARLAGWPGSEEWSRIVLSLRDLRAPRLHEFVNEQRELGYL